MKYRKKKKQLKKDILKSVYLLSPSKSDIIIFEFDKEKHSLEEIDNVFKMTKRLFPKNKIVAIPYGMKLGKTSMAMYEYEMLSEIIMRYFDIGNDTYAYNLMREKSESVDGITFSDFEEFNEGTAKDLARYIVMETP